MTAYISLAAALIGLVLYAMAANPKVQECGRLLYFAGILAFLIAVATNSITVLKGG